MISIEIEHLILAVGMGFMALGIIFVGGDILWRCGVFLFSISFAIDIYKRTKYTEINPEELPNILKKQAD